MSKRITVPNLIRMRERGEPITMLTAYDYTFSLLADKAGIDILLVGDSLGSVIQGNQDTLAVTLDDVLYHTKAVVRGATRALVVADMPFMSYQLGPKEALTSVGRLVKEAGAHAVKLEGGSTIVPTIEKIVGAGVPVMGHVGLMPQSIHAMGGHRVQGRSAEDAERVLQDAKDVAEAGAFALVLEGIPQSLALQIREVVSIPTIGIGAGPGCDGQVLVGYDMLGLTDFPDDGKPKFLREYRTLRDEVTAGIAEFVSDVRSGSFPKKEQSYT